MTTSEGAPAVVPMRLQKFLARAGVASRRGSENLMTAGRVTVNGQTVTQLGAKVDPSADVVAVDGRPVAWPSAPFSCLLYKPAGVLTTMDDPYGRRTVASLVPTDEHPGLFPVGRLDQDTTGLLLFTTDGELAQRLLHPRYEKEKRYTALVEGRTSDAELQPLRSGALLDDGPCAPARCSVLKPGSARARAVAPNGAPYTESVVELAVHEGRKHIVKRMLASIGHPVVRLHRHGFGPLELSGLEPGRWRELTDAEGRALREATGLDGGARGKDTR